jgi:hypothetical protein
VSILVQEKINFQLTISLSLNNGTDLAAHALAPYPANPPPQGMFQDIFHLEFI